jgi:hypothetical protein
MSHPGFSDRVAEGKRAIDGSRQNASGKVELRLLGSTFQFYDTSDAVTSTRQRSHCFDCCFALCCKAARWFYHN